MATVATEHYTTKSNNICNLFTEDVQFRVPIYQRRYVWNEDNWNALWRDIKENSDQNFIGFPQNHFSGTIVTEKINDIFQGIETHEIIDGQQRLTTFQIIFCVMRDLCTSMDDAHDIGNDLVGFLLNDPTLGVTQYTKLVLTDHDQGAFDSVLQKHAVVGELAQHPIRKVYQYFVDKISDYIGINNEVDVNGHEYPYKTLHNLYLSISTNFNVVQIETLGDESQKIFETLNATGRQLSEFDYLRNILFLRAGAGLEIEEAREKRKELYHDYWSEFEAAYNKWGDKKLEAFFWDFLKAKMGTEKFEKRTEKHRNIKAFDLYRIYSEEDLQDDQGISYEICQLKNYGENFRKMGDLESGIATQMQFYADLDIIDVPPLILYVISDLQLDESNTLKYLGALESYIVQSKLIGRSEKKICQDIESATRSRNDLDVQDFLFDLAWPGEPTIKKEWSKIGRRTDSLSKKFIRYIFYRIECFKRENAEYPDIQPERLDFSSLESLEHIMPLSWRDKWPLVDLIKGETSTRLYLRDLYTDKYKNQNALWQMSPAEEGLGQNIKLYKEAHRLGQQRITWERSIGNLTPISKWLNKTELSDHSFAEKKRILSEPSLANLILTREIAQHQQETWEGKDIEKREKDLLEVFFKIWPLKKYGP